MQNFLFIRLNPKNLIFFQWGVEECSDRASPPPGEDWRSGGAIQQERRDRGPNALSIAPPWGPRDPDRYGTFMRYSTMANSGTQKHLRVSLLEQGAFYFSLMLVSALYTVQCHAFYWVSGSTGLNTPLWPLRKNEKHEAKARWTSKM